MLAAPAADIDAKLALERCKPPLQRADDARRDAGRMPVHAHHGAERLEPERMRQPLQERVAAVMMDNGLRDDSTQRRHALREPRRYTSAMEREIGAAGP